MLAQVAKWLSVFTVHLIGGLGGSKGEFVSLNSKISPVTHFFPSQGGQGSPGGPGQHSGQDHSLCHR